MPVPFNDEPSRPAAGGAGSPQPAGRASALDGLAALAGSVPLAHSAGDAAAEALPRLAAIVESSDDAIVGRTVEGIITSWNAGAERVYGYSAAEAMGRSVSMLVPPDAQDELPMVLDALKRGEQISHLETVRLTKDGRRIDVLLTVSPIKDATGRVIGGSAITRDITDRKVLEEKLRRQAEVAEAEHQHLAMLIANVDVSMIVFDAEGRFVLVNDCWVRRNGIPREAAIGRRYEEMLGYPVDPQVQASVDRVLALGEPLIFQEWFYRDALHPQGIYVDGSVMPVFDGAGKVAGARAVSVDVTERVRARQAVEAQRRLLESIFAQTPVGIAVFDRDLRIVQINEEYARISRLDRAAVLGRVLYEVAPGSMVREALHERVLAGESVEVENVEYQFPGDSAPTYTDVRYRPIHDDSGAVTGFLSTIVDVTERVRNEKRLEAQQALHETLIEATPVGMIYLDHEMRVVDMNAAYARMAHLDQATVRGQDFYDLAPDLHEREAIHARVQAGESLDMQSVPYFDAVDKRTHYYDIFYRPVKDSGGAVTGMISAVVDVTERMELDRQKDDFLSIASHELRTPVTSIKGFSQLALRAAMEQKNERLIRPLHNISEQANHLTRLISDLLDVSRIETGRLPLHAEPFDLGTLLRDVVENLSLISPDMTCEVDVPTGPVTVNADRALIQQVVGNLLENAIKYSRDECKIEISLREESSEAVAAVRDFGLGIPEDQRERVFERFFRATNAGYHARNGLGLGLFIARDIIQRHGGRIWLESTRDAGSTFYFALPLA